MYSVVSSPHTDDLETNFCGFSVNISRNSLLSFENPAASLNLLRPDAEPGERTSTAPFSSRFLRAGSLRQPLTERGKESVSRISLSQCLQQLISFL